MLLLTFDGSGFTGSKQRDTSGICACNYRKCPAGGRCCTRNPPGSSAETCCSLPPVSFCLLRCCVNLWSSVFSRRGLKSIHPDIHGDLRVQKWGSKYFQSSGFWGSTMQQHLLSLKEAQSSEHLTFCLSVCLSFPVSFCLSIFNSYFCSFYLSIFLSFFLSSCEQPSDGATGWQSST